MLRWPSLVERNKTQLSGFDYCWVSLRSTQPTRCDGQPEQNEVKPNFQDLIIAEFRCALPSLRAFDSNFLGLEQATGNGN